MDMVGPSGSGKTSVCRCCRGDGAARRHQGSAYDDPKAITKDELYGTLDPTTLERTDGVFTDILRRSSTTCAASTRRHWIIFDGDVDPEAENPNSVLDDNKLLTLPSGERLEIPPNVRIMVERTRPVRHLPRNARRDGVVLRRHARRLARLRVPPRRLAAPPSTTARPPRRRRRCWRWGRGRGQEGGARRPRGSGAQTLPEKVSDAAPHPARGAGGAAVLLEQPHGWCRRAGLLLSLFSLLLKGVHAINEYTGHPDSMADTTSTSGREQVATLRPLGLRRLTDYEHRLKLCEQIKALSTIEVLDASAADGTEAMIDFEVVLDSGEWRAGAAGAQAELEAHKCLPPTWSSPPSTPSGTWRSSAPGCRPPPATSRPPGLGQDHVAHRGPSRCPAELCTLN